MVNVFQGQQLASIVTTLRDVGNWRIFGWLSRIEVNTDIFDTANTLCMVWLNIRNTAMYQRKHFFKIFLRNSAFASVFLENHNQNQMEKYSTKCNHVKEVRSFQFIYNFSFQYKFEITLWHLSDMLKIQVQSYNIVLNACTLSTFTSDNRLFTLRKGAYWM